MNPRLEIFPAPLRIDVGCPSHGKGVHPIFGFQDMRCIKTVLTPGPWQDAVVRTITLAVLVADITQLLFPINPIDTMAFALSEITSVTNAMLIKMDRCLLRILGVFVFNCGIGALVGYHALLAVNDRFR